MAYRDNVTALAAKLGVSNDPSLREEDLHADMLLFCDERHNTLVAIEATSMNRGSRLFFQSHVPDSKTLYPLHALDLDELRAEAKEYFAELWETNPEPGKRPLIDAIRNPAHTEVAIAWKRDAHLQRGRVEEDSTL